MPDRPDYGVVTRDASALRWPEFDVGFYAVKEVTGRRTDPVEDGVNMVSCFGDTAAVEAAPDLAAVTEAGEPATRDQPYFDWATVCPSRPGYREELLDLVEACAERNPDVRLDDVGFPRGEYCRCATCRADFESSEHDDWREWRASVVTGFVAAAAERVPGRTYLTCYPDPFPGHLHERSGVDLEALAEHVDEFVVPVYDTAYSTTWWVEAIASGFADRLDAPLGVELYAVGVDPDALDHAAAVAGAYAGTVVFAYDAASARDAVRRLAPGGAGSPTGSPGD